jgi:16S rRNA (guanine(527)-N(7))-methyltransferase RsmG
MTLEEAIASRAAASALRLPAAAAQRLAAHAQLVLAWNSTLHLTTITEPRAFIERHVGEAFEGAALLDASIDGTLVDLGSGNGYPGIPIAIVRPGLRAVLAESSQKKAAFLRSALEAAGLTEGRVLEASVQRAADVAELAPIDVLVTRATGGWESIVPRLVNEIRVGGVVMIWAGGDARAIVTRASWKRLALTHAIALPGRSASFVYRLERIDN